jgi:hypothetical protein
VRPRDDFRDDLRAWLFTGIVVVTFPFVAHAGLEETGALDDGGPFFGDDGGAPNAMDTGAPPDTSTEPITRDADSPDTVVPGPTLPDGAPQTQLPGADTGSGCTCTSTAAAGAKGAKGWANRWDGATRGSAFAPLVIVTLAWILRRRRG